MIFKLITDGTLAGTTIKVGAQAYNKVLRVEWQTTPQPFIVVTVKSTNKDALIAALDAVDKVETDTRTFAEFPELDGAIRVTLTAAAAFDFTNRGTRRICAGDCVLGKAWY